MRKIAITLAALLCSAAIWAQQSHVNITWDPQRNTDGILPYNTTVLSPEIHSDRSVTFRVRAPQAHEIYLTGSMFVGPTAGQRPQFTKDDKGIWSLTIGPLDPEIYLYRVVIDGVSNVDPNNTFTGHAAMPAFSMLFVHGDGPAWYDPKPEVPHGSITTHYYYSEVTKGLREILVYTPAGYDPSKQYPTLYLLGGSGDLCETWVMHGRANWILDNIIDEGRDKEMIVVFPEDQMVTRSHPQHTELAFPLFEEEMVKCIIPFVESHYSVIKDRHARAISGLSMGGRMSQYVGFKNLDLFGSFGLLSSAIDVSETPALSQPDFNSKVDYLFIGAGTYETNPRARHQLLHEELVKMGVKHEYYVGGTGAHDLVTWRHLLYYQFLPNLWRKNYNY